MSIRLGLVTILAALVAASSSAGAQVLSEKNISIKMALVIAETALNQCTPRVSIAVLDRAGRLRVFLQGDGASPHNLELARRKAYTALTFRRTSADWAKLPQGRKVGDVIGVAVDRGGNVWAFDRCGGDKCAGSKLAPILKSDSSGRLVNSFGAGMFIFPHGFSVDKDGNVWATDGQGKDGKGQQVFKFGPDGKVLLTLGKAGVAGAGENTFNRPSAVAVAANGDIFVAVGQGGGSIVR